MRLRKILAVYIILIVFTIAPVISALLAEAIAHACGANLNEADAHSCVILGMDIGEVLYAMFVIGWLALITLPLGLTGIVAYTLDIAARRHAKKKPLDR